MELTTRQHPNFERATEGTARWLDGARVWLLHRTMQSWPLRFTYQNRACRLGACYLLLSAFYLPLALWWPGLLLILGPLLLGYPHLVASYRFSGTLPRFRLFAAVTFLGLGLHLAAKHYSVLPPLPYAVWEIGVAAATLAWVTLFSGKISLTQLAFGLSAAAVFFFLAWKDPLIFAGSALILHNWVAFAYWIFAAKDRAGRLTALGATLVFGLIHALVFLGYLDLWIAAPAAADSYSADNAITGWSLVPWSRDPLLWSRALVLYTFGLSLHYFIWLKAIPESISSSERPHSFRLSLTLLKQELGRRTLSTTVLGIAAGMGLWFFSFSLGKVVYFSIATLHGWLELLFLVGALVPSRRFR